MTAFKNYSLVSDKDRKFTEYVNLLKKALEDDFAKYDSGYGYQINEFEEFCIDLLCDLYEDHEDNTYLIFHPCMENVTDICNFLANYDMINLNEKGHPIVNSSNNPDAANIINEMFELL